MIILIVLYILMGTLAGFISYKILKDKSKLGMSLFIGTLLPFLYLFIFWGNQDFLEFIHNMGMNIFAIAILELIISVIICIILLLIINQTKKK